MRVLFVDIYSDGNQYNFESTKHYLIGACNMTSFAICDDTREGTAQSFVVAMVKIWL